MKVIISFLLGAAVASALFVWLVLPDYGRDKYSSVHGAGYVDGQGDILEKIPSTLGTDYVESDGYHPVFEVKSIAVVVVERSGVKTLRVYPR